MTAFEPCTVTTIVPAWVLRDIERQMRERRSLGVTVYLKAGVPAFVGVGEERQGPPVGGLGAEPLCLRCSRPMAFFDVGRRLRCEACDVVWLEEEYRAEANAMVRRSPR